MKPLGKRRALDLLDGDEPCLGAAFCSYTFQADLFEDHILRAALRLRSDPVDDPRRYHQEARAALQQTPVVAVVDAGMYQPGHRLPYDLILVDGYVFHPKLALLLFDEHARLLVGSGNLTRGGFGDNAELWFHHDCRYDEDARLLRQIHRFLDHTHRLARHPGTQLAMFQALLEARLPPADEGDAATASTLLSSYDGAILPRFQAFLPEGAQLVGASVLAPFFESDLAHAADVESCDAVLQSLATDAHVPLEVGLVWDPAPIRPPHAVPQLDDLVGELCVWASQDDAGAPVVEYLHIDELTRQRIRYRDAYGQSRVHPRDDAEAAIHRGDLGPVGPITAYAPKRLLEALGDRGDLSFWLHPSWRFEGDRPQHRPLHAKLVLLRHTHRGREETLVLLGSPNPSRGALLLDVAGGGNVELAVAFALEGHHHLADICPELVRCDAEALTLEERPYRAAPPNLALWIESAVHDAADGSLLITWRDERPHPLPAWRIDYLDRAIASGEGRPDAPTLVTSFTLSPASCEIVLVAAGERYPLPITVRDLVALPSDASLADLSLEELLALLGRRIGGERLASLREAGGGDGAHHALEAIFGEGFAPTDVFRAWWSIADHLGDPRTTLGAFRGHVEGSLGAQAVWQRLHDTLTADDEARRLTRDEIWFYGAELLRTLRPIVAAIPEGPDAPAKRSVLATFLAHLEAELVPLSPDPTRGGWVAQVIAHYAVGGAPA